MASVPETDGRDLSVRPAGGKAQRSDAVEFGLLARVLLGLLARVVALVEHLDFLELLEGFPSMAWASSSWAFNSPAERLRFSRRPIAALA